MTGRSQRGMLAALRRGWLRAGGSAGAPNTKRPRAFPELIEVVLGFRRMLCGCSRVYTPHPEETPSITKHGARRMAPCTVKVYVRTNTACARPLLFIGDTPTPGAYPRRQEPSDNKKSMEPNLLPPVGFSRPDAERSWPHARSKDTSMATNS